MAVGGWLLSVGLAGCGLDDPAAPSMVSATALTPSPVPQMVGAHPLFSLTLAPAQIVLSQDSTQQFTATFTYADGSPQVRTNEVVWASSDDKLATVSNEAGSVGIVTARNFGVVTISATKDGISASAALRLN